MRRRSLERDLMEWWGRVAQLGGLRMTGRVSLAGFSQCVDGAFPLTLVYTHRVSSHYS